MADMPMSYEGANGWKIQCDQAYNVDGRKRGQMYFPGAVCMPPQSKKENCCMYLDMFCDSLEDVWDHVAVLDGLDGMEEVQ